MSNPLEHDPTRPIVIDGVDYMMEGQQGSDLALFNTLTGQTLTMKYTAVMRRCGLSDLSLENVVMARAADEHLTPLAKWKKDFLTRHVEEVAYGKPLDAETYRPEYDPQNFTQNERLDRKARELAPLYMRGTSRSNLKKLAGKLKSQDSAGLVDGRSTRIQDPFAGIDSRLFTMMARRVEEKKNDSTPNNQQLVAEVRGDWIEKYPGEMDRLPSEKTLRRKFKILTAGRYTTGSATNRRTNEGSPKRYVAARPAYAPGEQTQIDSTPIDMMVLDDNGEPVRPTLTTLICVATHSILAAMVTVGVKGIDLVYLLAKALSIPELRPGPALPFNLNEIRTMPWAATLIEADLEGKDTGRPIIRIQRIIMDLGRDFQSNVVLAACHMLCIDITNAAPGTGTDKAIVERSHRTIKDMFVRHLPGFTGGNPDTRGKNVEKRKDLISIHTLAYVLDLWIRQVWQNLETDALRNPEHPGRRYSPNTMYEALTYRTGCLFTPITRNTYISMLPVEERKIGRVGFPIHNRRYDSADLDPYRGKPSGNKLTRDLWRVHYEPDNPAAVWVYITELDCFQDAGKYIECPWVNADAFDSPFSRATRESAENIAALGLQISAKERSDLSRRFAKGAAAAADKEFREAADREQKAKLADEQGIGRPKPMRVVEPEDTHEMWAGTASASAYKLFDPDDIVNARDQMHDRSQDAAPDAPENRKPDKEGL